MMSLAHFEACEKDVSTDYAIDIATVIALKDNDEHALTCCDAYWLCMSRGLVDTAKTIVSKLKEYFKNGTRRTD